jgi:hypothetical protein
MTTTDSPAGWYPDQTRPGSLRYWDGTAWTAQSTPAHPPAGTGSIRPGLVGVWVTAILSLFTFYVRTTDATGHTNVVSIPVGIIFMFVCWRLVARAGQHARALGLALPGSYQAARIVAAVLAALSIIGSIAAMTG